MNGPPIGPMPPPPMPPNFGVPPVIDTIPAEPDLPNKAFQEAAMKFIGPWCRASRAYVREKTDRWRMLEALYQNRLTLSEWQRWRAGESPLTTEYSRQTLPFNLDTGRDNGAEGELWQSEYVHSPSFIVDTYVDQAFSQVFAGSDWVSIITEQPPRKSPEDVSRFTVAFKLEQLLTNRLEQAGVHARIYEALQSCALLGTVFAKVFWHHHSVPKYEWQITPVDIEKIETPDLVYECPVVQLIPLDRVLPDRAANHNDIQRWRGIGHTVDRTWHEIIESFDRGDYTLNEKLFRERYPEGSSKGNSQTVDGLYKDPDADVDSDEVAWFQIWEWHGKVPYRGKQIECCATIVTEREVDDPSDGVMVRLTQRPLLDNGLRPFVCAHFIQRPGCYGIGLVEREEDLLYQLSQFVGQAQDIVRVSVNPVYQVDFSSPAYQEIKKNGGILSPGMILPTIPGDPNSGLQTAKLPPYPTAEISNMVSFLSGTLERRTAVTDTQQGIAEREKTATEASILQAQGAVPTRARVQIFARTFLEPALNLALAMIQQNVVEDQEIVVRGVNGQDIPISISTDEIQEGRYRAAATLLRQDQSTIAKAQSIERALPVLQNLQPMLQAEGVQISFSELITRFIELVGIDGADRIIRQLPPQPPQPHSPMMAPGGGLPPMQGPPPSGPGQLLGQQPGPMGAGSPPGPVAPFSPGPPPMPGGMMPPQGPPMPPPQMPMAPNQPPRLVEQGGPMGQAPTDTNAMAQFLQLQALRNQGGMP
jgi:hypothetical protein